MAKNEGKNVKWTSRISAVADRQKRRVDLLSRNATCGLATEHSVT
jgi:hypothetical protein